MARVYSGVNALAGGDYIERCRALAKFRSIYIRRAQDGFDRTVVIVRTYARNTKADLRAAENEQRKKNNNENRDRSVFRAFSTPIRPRGNTFYFVPLHGPAVRPIFVFNNVRPDEK